MLNTLQHAKIVQKWKYKTAFLLVQIFKITKNNGGMISNMYLKNPPTLIFVSEMGKSFLQK